MESENRKGRPLEPLFVISLTFFLFASVWPFFSCRKTSRFNVVLVSIDTLRPDHLGCYGYSQPTSPTIDRLAREGAQFKNAFSTTTWTLPGHLALLTGLPDLVHGVISEAQMLDENRITLAEVLKKGKYRTLGVFTGPFLLPRWGFDQGFDVYQDATLYDKKLDGAEMLNASERGRTTPGAMDKVEALLDQKPGKPFFLFLHLFDAHPDFDPPPPYDRMFDPDYTGSVNGIDIMKNPAVHQDMDPRDLEHLRSLYDGEIRFIDEAGISRLVGILRKRGLIERTLIIITSDHGEEFYEHGVFGHRQNLYDTTLHIPLVLWCPALVPPGLVIKEQVRIIDIMPTILDLLGMQQSPEALGESLLPLLSSRETGETKGPRQIFCEVQESNLYIEGLRTEDSKVVVDYRKQERLYLDLLKDSEERAPLMSPEHPAFKKALDRFFSVRWNLVAYRDSLPWRATNAPKMDPELRERLKSLGYLKDR